jgi:hypothetical protein
MEYICLHCGNCPAYPECNHGISVSWYEEAVQIIDSNYVTYIESCYHTKVFVKQLLSDLRKLDLYSIYEYEGVASSVFNKNYVKRYGNFVFRYENGDLAIYQRSEKGSYVHIETREFFNKIKKNIIIEIPPFGREKIVPKLKVLLQNNCFELKEIIIKNCNGISSNMDVYTINTIPTRTKPAIKNEI